MISKRRLLNSVTVGSGGIDPATAVAGDICFHDAQEDSVIIVSQTQWNINDYPATRYYPIGVVVVPSSHNVYGDGSCGVMSLKNMNTSTPDEGSTSDQHICWGQSETDLSGLHNYSQVCHVGNNGNVYETVRETTTDAFLPSDQTSFDAVDNPYDLETNYYYNDSDCYIPSPYKNDGSFNLEYARTTPPSSTKNALSDFDGVGNTKVLCEAATAQSNWKTASSITNNSGSGYSPAACCCWRYHTDGTSQGDWYLPACGELGYMIVRLKKINETIDKMCTAYGSSVGVELDTRIGYWSSTKCTMYSSNEARYMNTYDGYVEYGGELYNGYVRAWLQVSPKLA